MTTAMIKINGKDLPYPSRGLTIQRQQFVDSARNALGQVVAQKINRRIIKLDNLEWNWLTAADWGAILAEIELFEGELEFWDALSGGFITLKVYWGDASEEIWKVDPNTGATLEFCHCKCNIIDCGY